MDKPDYAKNVEWAIGGPWSLDMEKVVKNHPDFKVRASDIC